jgi:hypothetical protein
MLQWCNALIYAAPRERKSCSVVRVQSNYRMTDDVAVGVGLSRPVLAEKTGTGRLEVRGVDA